MVRTAPSYQNLEKKFGNHVKNIWSHKMPGTPKFLILKSEKISTADEK